MFSLFGDRLLAIAVYAILAGSVAFGRPPNPRSSPRPNSPSASRPSDRLSEALWLGALAIVGLYPAAVALDPGALMVLPWAASFPGDRVVQLLGLAGVVAGGGLIASAFRALGRFATVRIELAHDHEIVREGPYARIRHPMYTANIFWTCGIALTFLSTLLWIPVLVVILLALHRAGREERIFLESERLGPRYSEYLGSTGRFLPRHRPRSRSPGRPPTPSAPDRSGVPGR